MLHRAFRAERIKLRHGSIYWVFFLLPFLAAVMGTFNYLQNKEILQNQWYSLWTQHTLFSCFFFLPATIGVFCAYQMRLEHTNHNWNAVMTAPIPVFYLFFSKLIAASVMVAFSLAWTGALFVLGGLLAGCATQLPPELLEWLLFGTFGGIVIASVQLLLSLLIRSFAVPVGIALVGGVMSIAALSRGVGAYYPYSLLSVGMRANQPGGPMAASDAQFIISSLIMIAICGVLFVWWIKKKDVKALR